MYDILVLLATFTLTWTNPVVNAYVPAAQDTTGYRCIGVMSLRDLDHIDVHSIPRWAYLSATTTPDTVVLRIDARGKEGRIQTCTINTDTLMVVYVTAVDSVGNVSCPSRSIVLNLPTTSVPVTPSPTESVTWYDILGRRISAPTKPGVYFKRVGKGKRSVVIFRNAVTH
jgi:hypothetical protein